MSLFEAKVEGLKNISPDNRAHIIWLFVLIGSVLITYFALKNTVKGGTVRVIEPVTPVDYSKDIDKYTCYQNRIPQEVMDLCDKSFPSSR